MEGSSRLNPYAAPFIPASRTVFTESFKEDKASEKQIGGAEKNVTDDKSAGYELPDSLSLDEYIQNLGKLKISCEPSPKGDTAGSIFDPSQHEGSDMDSSLVVESLLSMFPDVSTDFIVEALKANGFNADLTIDMLHDLLYEGDDYGYPIGVPESSSSSNLDPALQNNEPTSAPDAD